MPDLGPDLTLPFTLGSDQLTPTAPVDLIDTDIPQLDWPIRFATQRDGTVSFATVPQASPADLKASAAVVLCTPKGHFMDDPSFGISQLQWQQGHVDVALMAAEVNQSDPRLSVTATEIVDLTDATTRQIVAVTGAP